MRCSHTPASCARPGSICVAGHRSGQGHRHGPGSSVAIPAHTDVLLLGPTQMARTWIEALEKSANREVLALASTSGWGAWDFVRQHVWEHKVMILEVLCGFPSQLNGPFNYRSSAPHHLDWQRDVSAPSSLGGPELFGSAQSPLWRLRSSRCPT